MEIQRMTLDSEPLQAFRENMDDAMNTIVTNLKKKKLMEGTMTAKVKITLHEITTEDGEVAWEMKLEPEVSVKIGAKGKIKCGARAGIYAQFDDDGRAYIADRQISIEEVMDAEEQKGA